MTVQRYTTDDEYGIAPSIDGEYVLSSEYDALAAQVAALETNGIHTCHDRCPRIACVQGREIARLTARVAKLEQALLSERGKLEQADALCESLQNKLASRPLSAGDTDALEARVAELEANLNYIRTVCDNMLDTQPDADGERHGD
jgi:BMFP domain-containing protein YqiC